MPSGEGIHARRGNNPCLQGKKSMPAGEDTIEKSVVKSSTYGARRPPLSLLKSFEIFRDVVSNEPSCG